MSPTRDLRGKRFSRLVVYRRSHKTNGNEWLWECRCDCTNIVFVTSGRLNSGNTKSCGCLQRDSVRTMASTHNSSDSPTYRTWYGMKTRCNNKNANRYDKYGGVGKSYPEKWESFEGFFEDMGERPEGCTLDRIDNNLGYSKENCRWANTTQQAYNRTQNRKKHPDMTKYKGVAWQSRYQKFVGKVKVNGKNIHTGNSSNDLLLALRYDAVLEYRGLSDFTNKNLGFTDATLSQTYPCDFSFWYKCFKKIPQPLRILEE